MSEAHNDSFDPPEPEGLPLGKYLVVAAGNDVLITLDGKPKQSIKLSDLSSLRGQKEIAKRLKIRVEKVAEVVALLVAARAEKERQKTQTDSGERTPTVDEILSEAAKTPPTVTIHPSQDYVEGVGLTYLHYVRNNSAQILITSVGEFVVVKNECVMPEGFAQRRMVIDPTIQPSQLFGHVQNELASTTKLLREKRANGGLLEVVQKTLKDIPPLLRRGIWYADERLYLLDACWILGTYMHRIFPTYPYQNIMGMVEAGKTRNSTMKMCLVFKGVGVADAKETYLFRSPEQHRCTQIFDEDQLKTIPREQRGGMLAVARAGYKKGIKVPRYQQTNTGYREDLFEPYCPRIFAGIKGLEDALATRSLKIVMEKAPVGIDLSKEPGLLDPMFVELRVGAMITALCCAQAIKRAFDTLPCIEEASGREIEITQPLLAICSVCYPDKLDELKGLLKEMIEDGRVLNFTSEVEKMILRKTLLLTRPECTLIEIVRMLEENYTSDEKPKWLNRNRVTSAMENLKIAKLKRRTSDGVMYHIDLERVKKKAEQLGVTTEDADSSHTKIEQCVEYVRDYFSRYTNISEFWNMHEKTMIDWTIQHFDVSEETAKRVIADYRRTSGK